MNDKTKKQALKLIDKYANYTSLQSARKCALIDLQTTLMVLRKIDKKTEHNSILEEYVNEQIEKYTEIEIAIKSLWTKK